jgi:hypothetical protein
MVDRYGVRQLRCARCGEPIGVYEPIVLLLHEDGSERRGSILTLEGQLETPGAVVLHDACRVSLEADASIETRQ